MNALFFALALLVLPLAGQAASLQVSTSAGDTAAVVATCLAGSYPYGSDARGCSDGSGQVTVTGAPMSLNSAAHAVYPTGISTQATASASLGTLRAFAQTSIPAADSILHNTQSHAYADMQDTLVASSAYGTLYNNYSYSVNITGAATPSNETYAIPSIKSDAFVQLNIRTASSGDVLVSKYWETGPAALGGGVISGTLLGVPKDTLLGLDLFIQADSGVGTNASGQTGLAQADYSNTVHFYLDALTPGANTVSTGGYDYATAPAVPEPASLWTLCAGLGFLAWRRCGGSMRQRRDGPNARGSAVPMSRRLRAANSVLAFMRSSLCAAALVERTGRFRRR